MKTYDVVVVGGGIVGLATAWRLLARDASLSVVLLEKEGEAGAHQTGHNSGVIHSGLYYKPGSEKARTCVEGGRLLLAFCRAHEVPYEICGKLVVAANEEELPRLVGGGAEAGPNAVTALAREGYRKTSFNLFDALEEAAYPGVWKLLAKYGGMAAGELYRSFWKPAFVKALQKLMPEIRSEDLVAGGAGVRAQALRRDGTLEDDFVLVPHGRIVHVLNAPSPAATASLAIGGRIAEAVAAMRG